MNVVALAGGVGGSKLVDGLDAVLPEGALTVVVNTGDDFDHLGLRICPDLDTICYTLAGLAEPSTGWGRAGETWNFLEALGDLGGPTWFKLGDKDLALHVERSRRLLEGEALDAVTRRISGALGVHTLVLPMTNDRVETVVLTEEGELEFQRYFVELACEPVVSGFHFAGIENASPAPGVLEALEAADLVVLCPSNPFVSLDPVLSVPGVREAVADRPVVGISPIVGGQAVKGPAAKIFLELGIEPSCASIAVHYRDILDALVIDAQDQGRVEEIELLGVVPFTADIVMRTREDRRRLAGEVLQLAASITEAGREP